MNLSSQQSVKHKIETRHEFSSQICFTKQKQDNHFVFNLLNTKQKQDMNLSSQQSVKHKIETRHEFIKSAIC